MFEIQSLEIWHVLERLVSILENIPYIGNFSRGFNFRYVRYLPEIAKNRHGEK